MRYTFAFSGEITVIADSKQEAFEMADELVSPTVYADDHCEHITVDNIELIDEEEEESEET